MFPSLKVLLLNDNKIREIPNFENIVLGDETARGEEEGEFEQAREESSLTANQKLKIISLIKNPITNLEDFCHATQFPNLAILKLQNTPFVKTTSKNPDFIQNSHITVERHFENKKVSAKNQFNLAKKASHIKSRKIEPVTRFIKDKRWFESLIGELEYRVKCEVRKAVLGDLGSLESQSESTSIAQDENQHVDINTENPIFMTQFEFDQKRGQKMDTNTQDDTESFLSETVTDLSIINESDYSESRTYLRTPPMPIPDTVSRLRMELNKKNNISHAFNNDNSDNNNNIKKFLYEGPSSKPNTEKSQLVKNQIENDQKAEDVIHRMLNKLKTESAVDRSSLEKSDLDKFKRLEMEYSRLREQVGRMDEMKEKGQNGEGN